MTTRPARSSGRAVTAEPLGRRRGRWQTALRSGPWTCGGGRRWRLRGDGRLPHPSGGGARREPGALGRNAQRVGLGACRGRWARRAGSRHASSRAGRSDRRRDGRRWRALARAQRHGWATALRLVRLGVARARAALAVRSDSFICSASCCASACALTLSAFSASSASRAPEGHLCLVELLVVLGVRRVRRCIRATSIRASDSASRAAALRAYCSAVSRADWRRSRKLECGFYSPLSVSRCLHARVQLRVGGLQLGLRQLEGRLLLGTSRVRRLDVRGIRPRAVTTGPRLGCSRRRGVASSATVAARGRRRGRGGEKRGEEGEEERGEKEGSRG